MDLTGLAASVRSCRAGDERATAALRAALAAALAAVSNVPDAEALLECVMESFVAAGEQGKALLDELLLELLPVLAPLASRSERCSRTLSAFCSLAAAAAAPRDSITAFLEVLDQLLAEDSPDAASLQFMCSLLVLLPQQLGKLGRRRAAFAIECLHPAAALAAAQGRVLQAWTLAQLRLAAAEVAPAPGPRAAHSAVLSRLDTFLAAHWQLYLDFAGDLLHRVLPQEPDAAARHAAQHALGGLLLKLLLYLTALWPPPDLADWAVQLVGTPALPDRQLPSAASVAAPTPLLRHLGSDQHARATGTGADQQPQQQQQPQQPADSDAATAVLELLQLLCECGVSSWQDLASHCGGDEASGAALAALYSCCLQLGSAHSSKQWLVPPDTAATTLQAACGWCVALAEACDNSCLAILKSLALLQAATQHAAQLPPAPEGPKSAAEAAAAADDSQRAAGLLPQLEPCVTLLASTVGQAPSPALRAQARLALQQLLAALPPGLCYACLRALLGGEAGPGEGDAARAVHPEVAALLMDEVRLQLAKAPANAEPGSPFDASSCVQLVLPWLQQRGSVGWRDGDALAAQANAVCAALAVARLAVLRARAAGNDSEQASCVLRAQLDAPLAALAAAAAAAMAQLQGGGGGNGEAAAAGERGGSSQMAGEATGTGEAVDAWLALGRVLDVARAVLDVL